MGLPSASAGRFREREREVDQQAEVEKYKQRGHLSVWSTFLRTDNVSHFVNVVSKRGSKTLAFPKGGFTRGEMRRMQTSPISSFYSERWVSNNEMLGEMVEVMDRS